MIYYNISCIMLFHLIWHLFVRGYKNNMYPSLWLNSVYGHTNVNVILTGIIL